MNEEKIYDLDFVTNLFDEMSATYGVVNYVSSFGFCKQWRRTCVNAATIKPGMVVYDLMTGQGECWQLIDKKLNGTGALLALDISDQMCKQAASQRDNLKLANITLLQTDFLNNSLATNSADCIISSFGLKTFSDSQKKQVAMEIARILKSGGKISLLEISIPPNIILKIIYLFYLKYCIPIIGKLFLGNPDNYRLLGVYTQRFKDCGMMKEFLIDSGFTVEMRPLFFGCATLLHGEKI